MADPDTDMEAIGAECLPLADDNQETHASEYLNEICRMINEAYTRYQLKCDRISEHYSNNYYRQDFERRVAHAQYILETADMERERMYLTDAIGTAKASSPIVVMDGN